MTGERWAALNGVVERHWQPRTDRYIYQLNTGHWLGVHGQELEIASRRRDGIALLVREKWLDLQRAHFAAAYARGGYC